MRGGDVLAVNLWLSRLKQNKTKQNTQLRVKTDYVNDGRKTF